MNQPVKTPPYYTEFGFDRHLGMINVNQIPTFVYKAGSVFRRTSGQLITGQTFFFFHMMEDEVIIQTGQVQPFDNVKFTNDELGIIQDTLNNEDRLSLCRTRHMDFFKGLRPWLVEGEHPRWGEWEKDGYGFATRLNVREESFDLTVWNVQDEGLQWQISEPDMATTKNFDNAFEITNLLETRFPQLVKQWLKEIPEFPVKLKGVK